MRIYFIIIILLLIISSVISASQPDWQRQMMVEVGDQIISVYPSIDTKNQTDFWYCPGKFQLKRLMKKDASRYAIKFETKRDGQNHGQLIVTCILTMSVTEGDIITQLVEHGYIQNNIHLNIIPVTWRSLEFDSFIGKQIILYNQNNELLKNEMHFRWTMELDDFDSLKNILHDSSNINGRLSINSNNQNEINVCFSISMPKDALQWRVYRKTEGWYISFKNICEFEVKLSQFSYRLDSSPFPKTKVCSILFFPSCSENEPQEQNIFLGNITTNSITNIQYTIYQQNSYSYFDKIYITSINSDIFFTVLLNSLYEKIHNDIQNIYVDFFLLYKGNKKEKFRLHFSPLELGTCKILQKQKKIIKNDHLCKIDYIVWVQKKGEKKFLKKQQELNINSITDDIQIDITKIVLTLWDIESIQPSKLKLIPVHHGEIWQFGKEKFYFIPNYFDVIDRKKNLYNIEIIYKNNISLYIYIHLSTLPDAKELEQASQEAGIQEKIQSPSITRARFTFMCGDRTILQDKFFLVTSDHSIQIRILYRGEDLEYVWEQLYRNPKSLDATAQIEFELEGSRKTKNIHWKPFDNIDNLQKYIIQVGGE